MKVVSSVLIFILQLGITQASGPAAGTACIAACFVTCPIGGCAKCVGICAPAYACYDDNTTIDTTSGVKKIQDVEQGEHVLTIKDGKEHWSEVTLNMNIPVTVPGFFVAASDSVSGEEYKLHITASHNVPTVNDSGEFLALDTALRGGDGKKSFEHLAKVVVASDLEIGNIIQVMSANKKEVSLAEVSSIQSMSLDSKNVLFTADGTVLANGVLTAASCDLPMKEDTSLKEHMANAVKNTEYFTCVNETLSKDNLSATFSKAGTIGADNGNVYATDLFVYLLKHCGEINDAIPELLSLLDEDISPTNLDTASLLHLVLKKKVGILDANGDNVIDHIENPNLYPGMTMTAIEMNPFLCEGCAEPININKFLELDEVATETV